MQALMIQGTASYVGKSLVVTGLLRALARRGLRVTPFKAANLSLNAYVSDEGGELAMAQAVQAEAAGIAPSVHMNPVLLKPTAGTGTQVILQGKVWGSYTGWPEETLRQQAWDAIRASYAHLASRYDVAVIEGMGSPAEVNLPEHDLANMRVARHARAPVLLVGDIERGGVFSALLGTWELLGPEERSWLRGFIINKYHGDPEVLRPGFEVLEARTGQPVWGVLPYLADLWFPAEDATGLGARGTGPGLPGGEGQRPVQIAVLRLPHLANSTDFEPLEQEPGVALRFVGRPQELDGTDLVILPGSKHTIHDLQALRAAGFEPALQAHLASGGLLLGICGGYQMLGERIDDPTGAESLTPSCTGLGLVPATTVLAREKLTAQVRFTGWQGEPEGEFAGYEIHLGETWHPWRPLFRVQRRGQAGATADGACSADGRVLGTYLHGLFDNA
ncbi:MAG: cobyric acid synthase, partial [Deltaproteobacteria bacterium]|nr:cobyric acid synthase [Deltaproteobacteria bacterium]